MFHLLERDFEIGIEDARQAGNCDSGYSCAYTNNLSWRSETQPMPPVYQPRSISSVSSM